ncbi:helix-turn-helix domain-containing protein [Gluconobacter cerinus]|uniref:helix-turn-helix domain-containing protein n=1 Tax=Gluconobacter cerinus TaxID=38307 RepID=UPI001B8D3140|nr:helix-turn-helix transcriptional regulator [Gluconobacter cerinus]MBS1070081.1 helix-turn-helix transcriptional regulator [Gluconobacter cerinus]
MTELSQKIVGSCIRFYREKEGLSQDALATQAGISYQYLSGIETGRENFTIGVLEGLCWALNVPMRNLIATAYDNAEGYFPPQIERNYFRSGVPLPSGLNINHLEQTLNLTQLVIHRINRNMVVEGGKTLQNLIQGNNFSGMVSNILSNSFDQCSPYKHNHHQRYPDLVSSRSNNPIIDGLEVKTTMNIGKGGESHNGHEGWHVIACYNFLPSGDIKFVHIMFAWLNSYRDPICPDWKYVGSSANEETGSRRTETFNTTMSGTTKLRDGSIYLDPEYVNFSRWRHPKDRIIPDWSIWG